MNAVSPVRALVAYYWNTWYFLAAVFGAVSSLLLGAWISSAANGTPITGGYCVYFTATQPLICLSLLFACDARVAKAHYGGLPRHVYSAWTPCSLRAVFRALILTSVNLIGVLCFDAIMVLTGTGIHPHLAAVLCFVVLQSLATSLIYSIVEIAADPRTAGIVSAILCYAWILLPGDLPDYATPYVANALRTVGLNLNGTVMSPAEAASVRRPRDGRRPDRGAFGCLYAVEPVPSRRSGEEMKSLLRIERVAVIRWSTLAFVAVLLFPLFFLRYGNTGAVVQSAMVMALPVTAAGLVFSNARVPSSYRSFSIHDRLLLRFSVKSLSLGVVINVCLTLLYGLAVGFVVNETLSSRTILMLAFTAVVLSLACFVLRLWVSPLVAWNVVAFFIVAGLTVSSGMFEDAPMLYAVIPTTWVLNGVKFAGYVIPVGVVIAAISACLLFKAVKRV